MSSHFGTRDKLSPELTRGRFDRGFQPRLGVLQVLEIMKLNSMLIADPLASTAQLIADQCERLADTRLIATTAQATLALSHQHKPKAIVVALEMPKTTPKQLVPELLTAAPGALLIATYRELSVAEMPRITDLGINELVAQPVDVLQIFRAASKHYDLPFRRHDRFALTIDVLRADGVLIGKTTDISEGGLCMQALHTINPGESLLVDLALDDGQAPLRVRAHILGVDGTAPAPVRVRCQFTKLWEPEIRRLGKYLLDHSALLLGDAGPAAS